MPLIHIYREGDDTLLAEKSIRYWLVVAVLACALAGGDCASKRGGTDHLESERREQTRIQNPDVPQEVMDKLKPGAMIGDTLMTDEEVRVMAYNRGWAMADTSWLEWMPYLPAKTDSTGGNGMWMCEERYPGAWPTPSGCTRLFALWSVEGTDTTAFMLMIRLSDDKAVPLWLPHMPRVYDGG